VLRVESTHPRPLVIALHPPPEQRLEIRADQRGVVAPVLEHLVVVVGEAVEERAVVGPEAREEREVVAPDEHVDGVDLDQTETVEDPAEVPAVDPAARAAFPEALRPERDPAGLGERQGVGARHRRILGTDGHGS